MNFTFGSDPEFMISRWDELQSAIPLLPKKEQALIRNGSKFYYDNVLAEIAVKPASSKEDLQKNIENCLQQLCKLIKPARFIIQASAKYPSKQLNDKDAKIAGCNPEWNAYTLRCVLPPEEIISKTPFRTAGGHIHIGAEGLNDPIKAFDVIRMMDLFIGIPSIFLDTDETSKERRKIYGHAGSHRMTDYGFEYRSLGNFWYGSPEYVSLIYDLTNFVLEFVSADNHKKFWTINEKLLQSSDPSRAYNCIGYDAKSLCKTIDSCDKKQASKFMMFITNYLPKNLVEKIEQLSDKPLPDPYDAWNLA
jgi:hypothetical protein